MYKNLEENEYVKKDLDRFLKWKADKIKIKLSFDEKKTLLFQYCSENKKVPSGREQYKNINLGGWYNQQRITINNTDHKLYQILAEHKYIKKDLNRYLEWKEKNKNNIKLSFDENKTILFQYCNENKKTPPKKERYENANIGMWYQNQKKKINNNSLYKKLSENKYVKENLDQYLNKKSDK
jgi:hypothetical protein